MLSDINGLSELVLQLSEKGRIHDFSSFYEQHQLFHQL